MIANEIEKAIQDLGSTEDEIVRTLTVLGARGFREDASSCPIAVYLKHKLPDVKDIEVGCDVNFTDEMNEMGYVPLSEPFINFVMRFDQGQYPQLVLI